jgi:hypothetical protein
MNFKILECETTYGGLDTNISITYVNLDDYKVFQLIMSLDSVQDEIFKKTKDQDNLISSLVNRFHKYSKILYLEDMSSEMVSKLRNYKLYELLK